MSDKMREAFKVAFRKAASEDVDYDEAVDRGLAAALTAQAEQRGDVSGWYCAHCQHGVDPVDVTFGETHVYCGYPVTDCPAPPAPAVPDDTARLNWLEGREASLVTHREAIDEGEFAIWWTVTGEIRKIRSNSISGHPLGSVRSAIDAAMLAAAPEVKPC